MVKNAKRIIFQVLILLTAAGFIVFGIYRGELRAVFNKAVRICMECIGLG